MMNKPKRRKLPEGREKIWEQITPERAEEMLSCRWIDQRDENKDAIRKWEYALKNGTFHGDVHDIHIGKEKDTDNWYLLNGYTRLQAIVNLKITVDMWVCYIEDTIENLRKIFIDMDVYSRPRTGIDILMSAGLLRKDDFFKADVKAFLGAAGLLPELKDLYSGEKDRFELIQVPDSICSIFKQERSILKGASAVVSFARTTDLREDMDMKKRLRKKSVFLPMFLTLRDDTHSAIEFWSKIVDGSPVEPKNSAQRVLREYLLDPDTNPTGRGSDYRHDTAMVIRCWNAWKTKQPASVFNGRTNGIPQMVGVSNYNF
jgi:hypothetical protein